MPDVQMRFSFSKVMKTRDRSLNSGALSMRAALHFSAILFLAFLSACETVPEELDRPSIEIEQKVEDLPQNIEKRQSSAERNDIESEYSDSDSEKSTVTRNSDRNLEDLKDLAISTKTIAKVVLFAPFLPFCYLSKYKGSGDDCELGQ